MDKQNQPALNAEEGLFNLDSTYLLLAIFAIAVLGQANAVAVGAGVLLIAKLLQTEGLVLPWLEKSGMFWGLTLLIAAILVPLASGKISFGALGKVFTSWVGLAALLLSLLTTYLSGLGLQFLTSQGHADVMPALVLGAVIAAAFWGGVPVGPLITSGLLAVLAKLIEKV